MELRSRSRPAPDCLANTLSDELIYKIVCLLVVEELREDTVAKFDLENRALERVRNLKTVCSRWNSALQNWSKHVLKEILRLLDKVSIRPLFVLRQKFSFDSYMATLQDKVYIITNIPSRGESTVQLDVYLLNGYNLELEQSKEFYEMQSADSCAACHGCLYVVDSLRSCIWKITPDDLEATKWLEEDDMHQNFTVVNAKLSVTQDGNLMMILGGVLGFYGPDGTLLREIILPMNRYPFHVAEKSDGNLVVYHSTCFEQIVYDYEVADGSDCWEVLRKANFNEDVRTLWKNPKPDDEMIELCGCGVEHGNKKGKKKKKTEARIHRKVYLDSDDNVIAIDERGKQLMIFDSSGTRHNVTLKDSKSAGLLSDMHYDPQSNILFLVSKGK